MSNITHEIMVSIKSTAKSGLYFCKSCNRTTLHTRGLLIFPFKCVANHGGSTKCDGCNTYVENIVKVVVLNQWKYQRFCELCCKPDSSEKQERISERKRQAIVDALKPLDIHNPNSIARALGASSFTKRD